MLGKAKEKSQKLIRFISSRYLDKNAFLGALQVRHQWDRGTHIKEQGKILVFILLLYVFVPVSFYSCNFPLKGPFISFITIVFSAIRTCSWRSLFLRKSISFCDQMLGSAAFSPSSFLLLLSCRLLKIWFICIYFSEERYLFTRNLFLVFYLCFFPSLGIFC